MKRTIGILLLVTTACTPSNEKRMNRLADSTSPYLQQHATNPVDWYPWGEEALEKAKKEDKPILVSIGYSSCHWCHVMAHESFEDTAIARVMNEHFVNIKIDREERPDLDQIYMEAVQAMGINGGWPLNVFLTPDQKPFYGGTYFPKEGWKNMLLRIGDAYREHRDELHKSADQFAEAISKPAMDRYVFGEDEFQFTDDQIKETYQRLSNRFDHSYGGMNEAPKFPMPVTWEFLAQYYHHSGNEDALSHLEFTLEKMANGGIYDQIGGGFARYSVDGQWHVPHFEKMLYDNGQLLSLYATGYKLTENPLFREVMLETGRWLEREMLDASGGFYSALDADSEGVEGKFYVWTYEEFKELAGEEYGFWADYYNVSEGGNWEEVNILRKIYYDEVFATKRKLTLEELYSKVSAFKAKAYQVRSQRIRPGLDNKLIAGWNGLSLRGLSEAYQATGEDLFLTLAKKNAGFLKQLIKEGTLRRFPDNPLEGFLEDYAAVIQGFIIYYETTFDETYLELAKQLTDRVLTHFRDDTDGFFFFTGDEAESLIARKKEIFDNVIPASNSIMTWNLFHLGTHLYDENYLAIGRELTAKMIHMTVGRPAYLANWGLLALQMRSEFAEIVVMGDKYDAFATEINRHYLPNKILTASEKIGAGPLFEGKVLKDEKTTVFVCFNRACKLPVNSVDEALEQLALERKSD